MPHIHSVHTFKFPALLRFKLTILQLKTCQVMHTFKPQAVPLFKPTILQPKASHFVYTFKHPASISSEQNSYAKNDPDGKGVSCLACAGKAATCPGMVHSMPV